MPCEKVLTTVGEREISAARSSAAEASPEARGGLRLSLPAGITRIRTHPLAITLPLGLTWFALVLYACTRLIALPAFPIYFFTDEAVQTVSAADLVTNHFYSPAHELLPTYFQNGSQYNLSVSVYLQVIPTLLFGKSIWVTRGTAALMTLLAAISVGLIFKRIFKKPYPWLAVLILSTTPAWFLHSRTAFETALATSFFAVFLYFYLLYRCENPRWLYAALVAADLAFYAYSGMRPVLVMLGLFLFISDFKYHWRSLATVIPGVGLSVLLLLPLLRFLIQHPDASTLQMRQLGSYWLSSAPLGQKLGDFAVEYLRGLNPLYWYFPNTMELIRHVMPGYGHLLWATLPFGLLGIGLALRHVRVPAYRTLLLAVLAAPAGAALVQVGITRILVMVVPMAVLTALGAAEVLEWLQAHINLSRTVLSMAVFGLLAGVNVYMLWDALANGPLWFTNYGLTGMQYGAQQVFGAVGDYLKANPERQIILSPAWTNGTDVLALFFFPDPLPFTLASPDGAFQQVMPVENTTFIMIPEEFARIPRTRFADVHVEKTLFYPNGQPGFYFVRLKYVDNIAQVMAQEEDQRHKPLVGKLILDRQAVTVTYPRLDIGQIQDIFSGKPGALIRTDAINPMRLTFDFSIPRSIRGIMIRVGGMAMEISINAWLQGQVEPVRLSKHLADATELREVVFDFQTTRPVERFTLEIKNTNDPAEGHVHLWQLQMR